MRPSWAPYLLIAALATSCDKGQSIDKNAGGDHAGHAAPPPAPASEEHAGHVAAKPAEDEHSAHAPATHEGKHEAALSSADAHAGHDGAPTGMTTVLLDPARRQALGVRTAPVEDRSFERELRVSGIVRVDETRQSHIHLKFMGFVEKVFVNFVGRTVKKGEPLLTVYSPDLLAAESDFVQALASVDRIAAGEFAEAERRQATALIEAARARLTLLDVPAEEIKRLEQTRTPSRTLTIRSPLSGTVLSREVVDGMRVMPEMTLFVIADLRDVWVLADVFESDLSSVRVGTHAVIRFAGGAAPEREGRVAFIAPTLNETTRSAQVRVEVPNKDGAVRPGLFADVLLHVAGLQGLSVPDAAVIETGTRRIAFVESAPGRFEPRELHTGARAGGFVEVLHGLSAGEQVAVSAQFMLDAESQIRGSSAPGGHGGH